MTVFLYETKGVTEEDLHKDSVITSKTFQKKVVNKLQYIGKLLAWKYRVLYMDCDIILYRNPWPILNEYTDKNADIVAQKDTSLNSGFMYLMPTEITKELMVQASYYMIREKELDQESILAVLPRFVSLRLVLLPEQKFCNGKVFFNKHQFHDDSVSESIIMMHNNYIVGKSNKLYRMREMLYYNDDNDQYYSSNKRKYLMVDASDARIETSTYLRQVAYLARTLNRTFLLPAFPCPSEISADRCNLCRNDVECYKSFRTMIKENYRDYVAL